jgi:hypothetical protein
LDLYAGPTDSMWDSVPNRDMALEKFCATRDFGSA